MIISQQKLENQNTFGVIIDNNVKGKIDNIELIDLDEGILAITIKVTDPRYKGRILKDKVSYHSNTSLTWKYLNIRESAGVPYDDDEPERIDIDDLLLNKEVTMNLSTFNGVSKTGKNFKGQKICYVANKNQNLIVSNHMEDYDFEENGYEDVFSDEALAKYEAELNEKQYNIRKV